MKFFHLSDLHIGKQLYGYNLREDQEHILGEVISYAEKLRPDAVVIAGDIYDRSVPSGEAVRVFDDFLTRLSTLRPVIPVLVISGNHDSAQRLDYASRLLGSHQIYIAGRGPQDAGEHLQKVTLTDRWGEVHFYLMPFLKPGYVRGLSGGELPEDYTAAVRAVLSREETDASARNVLVSHQFYTGTGVEPATCDSEILNVGGIDNVDISAVSGFDYVALGHLHGAQRVGQDHIRYCGTLLKYSVSESGQEKALHVVELKEKGSPAAVETFPLHPLRDVRRVRGRLADVISAAKEDGRDDYVSVTLTDEEALYRPKEQLENVFHHILEIRTDNERTRRALELSEEEAGIQDPLQTFAGFFHEMQGRELSEKERRIVEKAYIRARGDGQ